MPSDKGKFSTEISASVIEEALRSVEKHTSKPPEGPGEGPSDDVPEVTEPSAEVTEQYEVPVESVAPDEAAQLREQLAFSQEKFREVLAKLKDEHERTLRATADLENYRKRAAKEKEEVQRFGIEKLLKDFLPVLDNLDRALEAKAELDALRQGVSMTRKLFEDTLAKHGVKSFTSVGKPFDPHLHEAMQQQETNDVPPNHVVMELVRGYTLNDRLVRPALVMVARAPGPAEAGSTDVPADSKPEGAS